MIFQNRGVIVLGLLLHATDSGVTIEDEGWSRFWSISGSDSVPIQQDFLVSEHYTTTNR